jgi:iron complex transport system permease protein
VTVSNLSPSVAPGSRARRSPRLWIGLLSLLLLALIATSAHIGSTGTHDTKTTLRGALALLGLGESLPPAQQMIVELRIWRSLVAALVGAALALSGALLQGVFRNDLASPAILGLSSGAGLGASIAILVIGGYGPLTLVQSASGAAPFVVAGAAFIGSATVTVLVVALATTGGRISVPSLLLVGIAINAVAAGLIAAIQSFATRDFEVARAMMVWSFGTLDDRQSIHALFATAAVLIPACVLPFVSVELDLFAGGEEDAQALGVDTQRTKVLALVAAALAAALAVAVAGQIAFVGLVVPHLVRLLFGRSHRYLLPMSLLGGAVFLLGADVLQRHFLGATLPLQPGVVMSLVGGPFFLYLLVKNRSSIQAW